MKAIVIHGAKDLRIEEQDAPSPGDGEVEIAIKAGGICGSDLHYYNHGGFGAIRVREPMILGREVAGDITATGKDATKLQVGDKVAISPSRPCNNYLYYLEGKQQHCLDMRFYGSAMPMPHIQGAFSQTLIAGDWQCHRIDEDTNMNEAAFTEPLAVAFHAVRRAGNLFGRKVLVTGCGPIGALCILAAKRAGAAEIIATDVIDKVLERAKSIGADRQINVAGNPDKIKEYASGKSYFDVMFEASGSQQALCDGLEVLRPRATLLQLGLGGDITMPQNTIVAKEIEIKGSFRFHAEFAQAVRLINKREIDVISLHTHQFGYQDAVAAFEQADDRGSAMKVQIVFLHVEQGRYYKHSRRYHVKIGDVIDWWCNAKNDAGI